MSNQELNKKLENLSIEISFLKESLTWIHKLRTFTDKQEDNSLLEECIEISKMLFQEIRKIKKSDEINKQ